MSSPESRFLGAMRNKARYRGQWIAILYSEVIAHGKDITKVYAEATKIAKDKTPLFVMIPDKEQTLIL